MNAPREGFNDVVCAKAAPDIFLLPGHWWFGSRAAAIRTLLGSCVAVSLWHPGLRLGGMCHYVLPRRDLRLHLALDGRYGDEAMELLVAALKSAGTRSRDFEARLWGGAAMVEESSAHAMNIGARNAARGRWLLRQHGFRLTQIDVAGTRHRRIELTLADGAVKVRYGAGSAQAAESPDGGSCGPNAGLQN